MNKFAYTLALIASLSASSLMAGERALPDVNCIPTDGSIGGKTPYLRVGPPLGNEPAGLEGSHRVLIGGPNISGKIPFYSGRGGNIGVVRIQVPASNCIINTDERLPMIFRCVLPQANLWQLHFHGEFEVKADNVVVYLDRRLQEAPMGAVVTTGFQGGIIISNDRGTLVESVDFGVSECQVKP